MRLCLLYSVIGLCVICGSGIIPVVVLAQEEPVPAQETRFFNPKKYEYRRSLIFTQIPAQTSTVAPKKFVFEIPAAIYQSIGTKDAVAVFGGPRPVDADQMQEPLPLKYEFEQREQEVRPLIAEDVYRSSAGGISYVFPLIQFRGSGTYKKGLVPVGSDVEILTDVSHLSGTVSIAYTTFYQGREFTYWQQLATQLPLWVNKDYFGINRTIARYDLQKLFTDPKIKRDEESIPYIRITVFPDEQYADTVGDIGFAARTHEATQDQPAKAVLIQSEESEKTSSERIYIFDTGEAPFRHHGLRLTIRDSLYAGTVSIESSDELGKWIFRGRDILASSPNQHSEFEKYFTTYKPTNDRYLRLTIKSLKGSVRPTEFAELMTDPIYAYVAIPKEIAQKLTATEIIDQNQMMDLSLSPRIISPTQPIVGLRADIYYAPNKLFNREQTPAAEIISHEGSITVAAFIGPEEHNPSYISLENPVRPDQHAVPEDTDQNTSHSAAVFDAAKNIGTKAWTDYREPTILGIISLMILFCIGAVVRSGKSKTKHS